MRGGKNSWVLLLCILAGIVIGGAIGNYLGEISYLSWLKFGYDFGIPDPFTLDFGIIMLRFGFMLKISIASLIGIAISVFVYKKLI
jgi:hypothetical protein